MGTEYFAIVEQQQPRGHWLFISFWRLDKVFELAQAVHEINPARGTYQDWNHVSHPLTSAFGNERYYKTALDRAELPTVLPEYGEAYASLVNSLQSLEGNVRVLFCQDQ